MNIKKRFKRWLAIVLKDELLEYCNFIPMPPQPPVILSTGEPQLLKLRFGYREEFCTNNFEKNLLNDLKTDLVSEAKDFIDVTFEKGHTNEKVVIMELIVLKPKKI